MKNKVKIEEIEQNVNKISYKDGKVLYLVGTAHISEESKDLVEKTINEYKPDTISVELDELRFEKMMKDSKYEDLNVFQIIKKKQLFFFIGQFILGSFQKKMAKKTKSKPGEEFKKAVELANESGAKIVLADRNIGITLKRAWRLTKFWDKIKLIGASFFGADEDIDKDKIEEMKKADAIEEMVKGFADELPDAKKVLIDERDTYLGYKIVHNLGKVTVAVVGAGHVNGILEGIKNESFPESLDDISEVPPAGKAGKIIPWVIPIAVMALFVWGFTSGRTEMAQDVIIYWVLANGILTAIGCLIAFGHPLTVIAGFIAAPITSLNPTIGAGFVTAIVQSVLLKPRMRDIEEIQGDDFGFKKWWKNRVTRIFLVFIFSSIGSSIGTFVALPMLTKMFSAPEYAIFPIKMFF